MYTEKIMLGDKAYMTAYLLDSGLKFGQDMKRPAVVINPGGGYIYLSPREAEPVALAYAAKGFHTFVLNYSLGYDAAGFAPLKELDQAIGIIRQNADKWLVAEDKIAVCGFSAGGHLALAGGILARNQPNAMILGYPAVSLNEMPAIAKFLSGKGDSFAVADLKPFDLVPQVDANTPPAFVFVTGGDKSCRTGCIDLVAALDKYDIPCEFHLFGFGPHGYSLADRACADGSSQVIDPHAAKWLDLSAEWLVRIFGGLEFTDTSTSRIAQEAIKLGIDMSAKPIDHA